MKEKAWKKVTKAGPGQYWCGGIGNKPSDHPWYVNFDQEYVFSIDNKDGRWMYYIGPPLEKPPEYIDFPKDGDPVVVRVAGSSLWERAYATGEHEANGKIFVYAKGGDRWSSYGYGVLCEEWRRPSLGD